MNQILISTLAAALLFVVGCGGSTNKGDKPAGAYASCVPVSNAGGASLCFAFSLPDGGSADAVCAGDTENGIQWTSTSSCALPGLVGCCGMLGTWQCFYSSDGDPKTACTSDEGMWSTTAP